MHKNPNDLEKINTDHNFCAYDRGSNCNVLFIGSCRLSPLMFYYSLLNEVNIYNVYLPYWTKDNLKHFPISRMNDILSKTKLIITENASNFGILNTSEINNNFFDTFKAKSDRITIPNLHLSVYLYDIIHKCKKDKKDYSLAFSESLGKLNKSCKTKKFDLLFDFIVDNFTKIKLFYTINHPSKILSMLTFKIIMDKLGEKEKITENFFAENEKYNFLEGNSTPIVYQDIEEYKFTFYTKIFENNIVDDPDFSHYKSDEKELKIESKYLNIIQNI